MLPRMTIIIDIDHNGVVYSRKNIKATTMTTIWILFM